MCVTDTCISILKAKYTFGVWNFRNLQILCIDPIHSTSSSEQSWMRHFGGQYQRVILSEVPILGDAAFTCNPFDYQHGERGISRRV